MMIAPPPGVSLGPGERPVEHLERAASAPPDPADLERARNRMLTEHYGALQNLENRADVFSQHTTFFDDPGAVAREADRYQEIAPADLTEVAARYAVESERVVVAVVPREAS